MRNTCINYAQCHSIGIPLAGVCDTNCPENYTLFNAETGDIEFNECFACNGPCPKLCDGEELHYLIECERVRGCNVLAGSLYLKFKSEFSDPNNHLSALSSIQEIHGCLKIVT